MVLFIKVIVIFVLEKAILLYVFLVIFTVYFIYLLNLVLTLSEMKVQNLSLVR